MSATQEIQKLQSEGGEFWEKMWSEGHTGWHKDFVQEILKNHFSYLTSGGQSGLSVFVPLCGKSLDMVWLSDQGLSVVGCDISELAVQQFYTENNITVKKYSAEGFLIYEATDRQLKLYVGDIYNCIPDTIGQFDCIWDCNAIVAVNPEDRQKYADTLKALLKPNGKILMSTYEFDQSLRSEFPHCVPQDKVNPLFESKYSISLVESIDLKGSYFLPKFNLPWATRHVFHIEKRTSD